MTAFNSHQVTHRRRFLPARHGIAAGESGGVCIDKLYFFVFNG